MSYTNKLPCLNTPVLTMIKNNFVCFIIGGSGDTDASDKNQLGRDIQRWDPDTFVTYDAHDVMCFYEQQYAKTAVKYTSAPSNDVFVSERGSKHMPDWAIADFVFFFCKDADWCDVMSMYFNTNFSKLCTILEFMGYVKTYDRLVLDNVNGRIMEYTFDLEATQEANKQRREAHGE